MKHPSLLLARLRTRQQSSGPQRYRCGLLFRPGSLWIGAHWSAYNRRLCINLVPCITFWITAPGGVVP